MSTVQSNTQVGDRQMVAAVDLTGMEGRLVALTASNGEPAVMLPTGDVDRTPYLVLEGAGVGTMATVRPLEAGRNMRMVLAGTCDPGDVLVLADTAVTEDQGKVRELPVAAGSYRSVAIAEEAGVDGQWVLVRPIASEVIEVV